MDLCFKIIEAIVDRKQKKAKFYLREALMHETVEKLLNKY